jgi:N-acetylglucosaminyl-diphospho-decaprenol L-rhamnosyltransferase
MVELSVIIVNWNVLDLLRVCIRSVEEGWHEDPAALEILVVDNASNDGSAAMVRSEFPRVNLIENHTNTGFTAGNNQAIERATGRYILLLNPDTEILGDALHVMLRCLRQGADVGALGPKLLNPDGAVQSSRRRFPTLATAILESTALQQWWRNNAVLHRYYVLDQPDDAVQDVDWVVGACLLARRESFTKVGLLDETFFMYSEEMDWCYRLKKAGQRVVFLPDARVVHHGGQSSRQVVAAQHIHFQRSKIYFFRKHHGLIFAEVLRIFLFANYGYQLGMESLKWLLGHKRALRAERVRAYSQVLRSGL